MMVPDGRARPPVPRRGAIEPTFEQVEVPAGRGDDGRDRGPGPLARGQRPPAAGAGPGDVADDPRRVRGRGPHPGGPAGCGPRDRPRPPARTTPGRPGAPGTGRTSSRAATSRPASSTRSWARSQPSAARSSGTARSMSVRSGAVGFEESLVGLLDPGHLVLGVTGGDVVGPPGGDQLLGAEGPQRLEQPVPAAAGAGDERPFDQVVEVPAGRHRIDDARRRRRRRR